MHSERLCYLDTSSFMRLVVPSEDTGDTKQRVDWAYDQGCRLVSSTLLRLEAQRARIRKAIHEQTIIDDAAFRRMLGMIVLVNIEQADLERAGGYNFHVGSLDALHLATAQRLGCEYLITDDDTKTSSMKQVAESQLGIQTI